MTQSYACSVWIYSEVPTLDRDPSTVKQNEENTNKTTSLAARWRRREVNFHPKMERIRIRIWFLTNKIQDLYKTTYCNHLKHICCYTFRTKWAQQYKNWLNISEKRCCRRGVSTKSTPWCPKSYILEELKRGYILWNSFHQQFCSRNYR